jgi:hypothetical protein
MQQPGHAPASGKARNNRRRCLTLRLAPLLQLLDLPQLLLECPDLFLSRVRATLTPAGRLAAARHAQRGDAGRGRAAAVAAVAVLLAAVPAARLGLLVGALLRVLARCL